MSMLRIKRLEKLLQRYDLDSTTRVYLFMALCLAKNNLECKHYILKALHSYENEMQDKTITLKLVG